MKNDKDTGKNILPSIEDIIEKVSTKPENNQSDMEVLSTLELAKVIITKFLDIAHLDSLTFLSPAQVDDIAIARLLNNYYRVPEISEFITNFESLKRSEGGKLAYLLSEINKNDIQQPENKKFFDKILKRN